ncbi:MAG: hypothetical protein Q9181_008304, partial [Wetmoreana brouardii]
LFNDDEYQPDIETDNDGEEIPGADGGTREQKRKDRDKIAAKFSRATKDPSVEARYSVFQNIAFKTTKLPAANTISTSRGTARIYDGGNDDGNDDEFICTPETTPPLSAGEESSPLELFGEGLVSPPPPRHSARISKESSDFRTSQTKLLEVQKAGILKIPKAPPKPIVQAARTGESRGRSTVRMQSALVRRKRTLSTTSTASSKEKEKFDVDEARPTKWLRFADAVDE